LATRPDNRLLPAPIRGGEACEGDTVVRRVAEWPSGWHEEAVDTSNGEERRLWCG